MPDQVLGAPAQCKKCKRVYRVSDPEKAYRCKDCGGTIRAAAPAADRGDPLLEGTVTCPECSAVNAAGARFCAECRAVLDFSSMDPSGEENAELRRDASQTLRRAYRWIGGVTWLYRIGALAYAVATIFAMLALARTEVPLRGGVLVVILTTSLSVLMLMGALHILFRPFLWTVAIALLASTVTAVHYLGPNPYGLAFLGSAAWAAVAWAALVPTWRFRRLIAEHKDLYILHHASRRTKRAVQGQFAKQRHERLLAAMRQAARRAWRVSTLAAGLVVLVSALGTSTVVARMRPPELAPSLAEFQAAWNATDLPAVTALFDPEVRTVESTRLAGVLDGHGWRDAWPPLSEGEQTATESGVRIDYELGSLTLSADWYLDGRNAWSLVRIELPVPPLEPACERFVEAWHGSDARALASFFSSAKREQMQASIASAAESREWRPFPRIVATDTGDYGDGRGEVSFALERGEVQTEWHLRADGSWALHGLEFPPRRRR